VQGDGCTNNPTGVENMWFIGCHAAEAWPEPIPEVSYGHILRHRGNKGQTRVDFFYSNK